VPQEDSTPGEPQGWWKPPNPSSSRGLARVSSGRLADDDDALPPVAADDDDRLDGNSRVAICASRDVDDSGESSPSTSMATLSIAPSSAGADMVRSGATSSDGAEVVRCGATCSDGAMVVLTWAKTSWADCVVKEV